MEKVSIKLLRSAVLSTQKSVHRTANIRSYMDTFKNCHIWQDFPSGYGGSPNSCGPLVGWRLVISGWWWPSLPSPKNGKDGQHQKLLTLQWVAAVFFYLDKFHPDTCVPGHLSCPDKKPWTRATRTIRGASSMIPCWCIYSMTYEIFVIREKSKCKISPGASL